MHKHLKQPLVPPDHINTALSAGVGEIIEVAMAKNREERYASTADMLEDLQRVRAGNPPIHARRAVDLDQLAKIEETGKTVDIAPSVITAARTSGKAAHVPAHRRRRGIVGAGKFDSGRDDAGEEVVRRRVRR